MFMRVWERTKGTGRENMCALAAGRANLYGQTHSTPLGSNTDGPKGLPDGSSAPRERQQIGGRFYLEGGPAVICAMCRYFSGSRISTCTSVHWTRDRLPGAIHTMCSA